MHINRTSLRLTADPRRVIARYLYLGGLHRIPHVIDRIKRYSDADIETMLTDMRARFAHRHRDLEATCRMNYDEAIRRLPHPPALSPTRQLLLGACLTLEYSIESAALFNPSIVRHPDQSGVATGALRFVMSLRATGEGHISSIEFRTGTVTADGRIDLDELTPFATRSAKDWMMTYTSEFVRSRLHYFPRTDMSMLSMLPDRFTAPEALKLLDSMTMRGEPDPYHDTHKAIREILDTNYDLLTNPDVPLSERVLFPNAMGEKNGMEDARFVQFRDGDDSRYYGTYTAYDGKTVKIQLIETLDFVTFRVRTLYGDAVQDKGMALFPEKIGGRYAMIGRQGGEFVTIMFSDDLYVWNTFQTLLEPEQPWELLQLGNCGSPIKTGRGWLLLTHGVGLLRRYVISAVLLDLNDPTKVLARLKEPLFEPTETEREGYVPNVVYTCGWLDHGDRIVVPYAMSDSACGFLTIHKEELLNELLTT